MAMSVRQRVSLAWNILLNKPINPLQKNFPFPINVFVDRSGQTQFTLVDYETYAKEGMAQNSVVYSSLKYKFDSVSQAPLRAYTGHPDDAILLDDFKHPLSKLALRPNSYMSRVEFMQYCVVYLNVHGNCFIALTGVNDNLELGMFPLRPDRVRIIPQKSEDGTEAVIGYAYYPQGATEDTAILILPENMAHIKFPNPYDHFEGQGYGLSPMSAAAYSIDTDNEMTRFLTRFFRNNGMMPGGTINLPYESDPEDITQLRDQLVDMYGGSEEWGKPLVIDKGGTYTSSVPSFKDMALDNIDFRNIQRTAAVFGVDGMLIGLDRASSTFSNRQEAKDDFWERVMYTELLLFEEELRHKVDLGDGTFLRYDLTALPAFAVDTNLQAETYVQLVNNFVPPNEAKLIVGLSIPDMEGGDISYMPVGLVPVRQAEIETERLESGEDETTNNLLTDGNVDTSDSGNNNLDANGDTTKTLGHYLNPILRAIKAIVWDYEKKDSVANEQDTVTRRFEPQYKQEATSQFEKDKRSILSIFNRHKKSNHKEKKTFDYTAFKQAVNRYLFGDSARSWGEGFAPLFVETVIAGRKQWNRQLDLASYMPQNELKQIISGQVESEYWFSNYTLTFARQINTTTNRDIQAIIANGLNEGFGTDKIGNKIELLFEQYMFDNTNSEDWEFMQERMPPFRTEMIARTETHGAMSAGNHAFFELSGVELKEWWATGDDRTRESHLKAWNEYTDGGSPGAIPINDNFRVGGAEMRHPGDRRAPLREFINCFVPNTKVSGTFLAGSKVWYSGTVRELITSRGYRLTVTPYHPILTNKGWVFANDLVEGDTLFSYSNEAGSGMLSDIDNQDCPITVKNVFNSISMNGSLSLKMVSALDFDSDGRFCDGNIDIVSMNRVLPFNGDIENSFQDASNFEFISPDGFRAIPIKTNSAFNLSIGTIGTATSSFPSGAQLPLESDRVFFDTLPFKKLGFGAASKFNTTLGKESRDDPSIAREFISELFDASASKITPDNLVRIVEYDFSGHVYDLQTVDNWILAENIVSSNCRCVELPFFVDES